MKQGEELRRANRRLFFIMIGVTLAMTAYWLYFIIVKEPIQP